MNRILSKFVLQEGLRLKRALEYFDILHQSGLITFTNGHKSWKYHPENEWELFRVEI